MTCYLHKAYFSCQNPTFCDGKSDQNPDPHWFGSLDLDSHWGKKSWIRIEVKSWIRIRTETNADPKQWQFWSFFFVGSSSTKVWWCMFVTWTDFLSFSLELVHIFAQIQSGGWERWHGTQRCVFFRWARLFPPTRSVFRWAQLFPSTRRGVFRRAQFSPPPRCAFRGSQLVSSSLRWVFRWAPLFAPFRYVFRRAKLHSSPRRMRKCHRRTARRVSLIRTKVNRVADAPKCKITTLPPPPPQMI